MAEYDTLSLKLTGDIRLTDIDNRAEELGLNRSKFVNLALEMMVNFDLDFWKRIQKYSEELQVPEWMVIQNLLIKRFALEEAGCELLGHSPKPFDEFVFIQRKDGIKKLTGEQLFDRLKMKYTNEMMAKIVRVALDKEKTGSPLFPDEQEALKKYRAKDPVNKEMFDMYMLIQASGMLDEK